MEEKTAPPRLDRIATQCLAVDTLTDGGLATGTITQIFGEKALGKSIISFQAACATVATGASAIILDTEQSYSSYLMPYWKGSMGRRFGKEVKVADLKAERVPKSEKKNKTVTRGQLITELGSTLNRLGVVYTESHLVSIANTLSPEFDVKLEEGAGPSVMVMQVPEVTDLLNLHGIDAAKEVSEGGRVELRLRGTPTYQSVLHQIIRRTGAKLLVYDSISAPFKAAFPSTQDLPARSSGMAMLFAHAQRLCVEFGIAVLVISHVSIDPIKAWDRVPYGGVILGHDAKFSLELTKATATRNGHMNPQPINPEAEEGSAKAFWVARHPAMAEYSKFGYAKIDEEGFH
jgi:RecA/RadA recombinase